MTEIFPKNEHHMQEKKPDQSVAVAENGIAKKGLADALVQHPANWFNNCLTASEPWRLPLDKIFLVVAVVRIGLPADLS